MLPMEIMFIFIFIDDLYYALIKKIVLRAVLDY